MSSSPPVVGELCPTLPVVPPTETSSETPSESAANTAITAPTNSTPRGKPATVEDASDSEDETKFNSKHEASSKFPSVEKGKGKEKDDEETSAVNNEDWQAVWSAPQNAYYFYNTKSFETTWINPLAPPPTSEPPNGGSSPPWDPSAETLPGSGSTQPRSAQPFSYGSAHRQQSQSGIDPSLAHLLPGGGFSATDPSTYTAQARFNTRTGRYETPADSSRAPDHLSDHSKMKRQNDAFFDTEAWEREKDAAFEREQAGGGKRKKLTKSDVERFKEKKEAKKKQKNAWLRS
ncbi:WW domain [Phaffia rhodozyma]|uniref:WW domain n=1 Tax=Phaffia rhodozyma TaxID=264483 RepID=A0A0F7SG57_PHARH|nr:WW domain [Phaffia rhodozyma]